MSRRRAPGRTGRPALSTCGWASAPATWTGRLEDLVPLAKAAWRNWTTPEVDSAPSHLLTSVAPARDLTRPATGRLPPCRLEVSGRHRRVVALRVGAVHGGDHAREPGTPPQCPHLPDPTIHDRTLDGVDTTSAARPTARDAGPAWSGYSRRCTATRAPSRTSRLRRVPPGQIEPVYRVSTRPCLLATRRRWPGHDHLVGSARAVPDTYSNPWPTSRSPPRSGTVLPDNLTATASRRHLHDRWTEDAAFRHGQEPPSSARWDLR
jgi:hypothetical protein